jgi:hypothetical protein
MTAIPSYGCRPTLVKKFARLHLNGKNWVWWQTPSLKDGKKA